MRVGTGFPCSGAGAIDLQLQYLLFAPSKLPQNVVGMLSEQRSPLRRWGFLVELYGVRNKLTFVAVSVINGNECTVRFHLRVVDQFCQILQGWSLTLHR